MREGLGTRLIACGSSLPTCGGISYIIAHTGCTSKVPLIITGVCMYVSYLLMVGDIAILAEKRTEILTYTVFSLSEKQSSVPYMGNLGDQLSGAIPTIPCA